MAARNSFHVDYSALCEEIETNHKAPKFKVEGRVRISKYKKILTKGSPLIGQEKYFLLTLLWKQIFGRIKLKILMDKIQ